MFEHCLYFNTAALARRLEHAWAEAFEPFGLTPPQAFLLRTILSQPGRTPSELAELMVISRPTATRALDGLLGKGLIERATSARDGREQCIHPTAAARALHDSLNRAAGAVTARMKKLLGQDGFSEAVASVRRVRASLD